MNHPSIKRIAIYARVSTNKKADDPKRQETENQRRQLREYAGRNGWAITREYVDLESGTSSTRKEFEELFTDARQRHFDLVLFWSLDRFSREGVLPTLSHLQRLSDYGVAFRSLTEEYIDSAGMFKDAIISILATLAKQEAVRQSERVRAGLERARANGKALGRPRTPEHKADAVRKLRNAGKSLREVAKELGMSHTSVVRLGRQTQGE